MKKQQVLKLNSNFYPLGITDWKKSMVDIFSGAAYPVDVYYGSKEDGSIDLENIETFNVVRDWKEWVELPIRPYDEYVNTPSKTFRVPPVVVCSTFDKIIYKNVQFPTKANIWKRDKFTCGYTGEKLTRENITVDHILPSSRGGQNSWTNLITCEKNLNVWKADRTPKECGLKLLWKPEQPTNGMVFDFLRKEWEIFLYGGKSEFGE